MLIMNVYGRTHRRNNNCQTQVPPAAAAHSNNRLPQVPHFIQKDLLHASATPNPTSSLHDSSQFPNSTSSSQSFPPLPPLQSPPAACVTTAPPSLIRGQSVFHKSPVPTAQSVTSTPASLPTLQTASPQKPPAVAPLPKLTPGRETPTPPLSTQQSKQTAKQPARQASPQLASQSTRQSPSPKITETSVKQMNKEKSSTTETTETDNIFSAFSSKADFGETNGKKSQPKRQYSRKRNNKSPNVESVSSEKPKETTLETSKTTSLPSAKKSRITEKNDSVSEVKQKRGEKTSVGQLTPNFEDESEVEDKDPVLSQDKKGGVLSKLAEMLAARRMLKRREIAAKRHNWRLARLEEVRRCLDVTLQQFRQRQKSLEFQVSERAKELGLAEEAVRSAPGSQLLVDQLLHLFPQVSSEVE